MPRTITAYFDTVAAAEAAGFDLAKRVGGVRGAVYDARNADRLSELGLPESDLSVFQEGFRRGGGIVHAQVPDELFEQVADTLEASGAVDLDAREAEWRPSGSAGSGTPASSPNPSDTGVTGQRVMPDMSTGATASAPSSPSRDQVEGEERIPIVEERLQIGKRAIEHGRVRIRSYVVETPVQEQVTLRDEHVRVERRPVDLPLSAATDDPFRERTIEVVEHDEEAVVSKEARVKEDVVLRRDVEERTETVSDTVRRTEVKIEDDRDAGTATQTGTTDTRRPGR